jgi:hypothetical protein
MPSVSAALRVMSSLVGLVGFAEHRRGEVIVAMAGLRSSHGAIRSGVSQRFS